MKVLFVTHTTQWIGPNVSLLHLIRHLPPRFEAEVVYPGSGSLVAHLAELGTRGHSMRSLTKQSIPRLWLLMRRRGVDLVYGNSASGVSKNALIAAKAARIPFVYHLREMAGAAGWRKTAFLKYADALIAVSMATANSYRPYCRRAPVVVHNGLEMANFVADRCAARRRLAGLAEIPVTELGHVLVHVGNLYRRKGQLDAVRAFESLAAKYPGSVLILFGRTDRDAAYTARVRQISERLGLAPRVVLVGMREDLPLLLPGADLYLHTAVRDPHPRSVIEAMASQLPAVAYATDGVSETVVDGETGFLVEVGDVAALARAASRLLRDIELRRRFGAQARRIVSDRFTAERTAEGVCAVLDEVLS